jgi:hypothetical protein
MRILYLILTGLSTINLISCDRKSNDIEKTNQIYITEKGDSLETGFWELEIGRNGVGCRGNFIDGFRTDKWTYYTNTDTTTFAWKIFNKDGIKFNIPDYITETNQEEPTVFQGNINKKDKNCYFILLRYDINKINSSIYDYLYPYVEAMEKGSIEVLKSREIKKYTFKNNIEIFRTKLDFEGKRKYQAISYIFVINNILYDLTYRDFSEEIDKIDIEVFTDILYSFETSEMDLFNFNNMHYLKEDDVIINISK